VNLRGSNLTGRNKSKTWLLCIRLSSKRRTIWRTWTSCRSRSSLTVIASRNPIISRSCTTSHILARKKLTRCSTWRMSESDFRRSLSVSNYLIRSIWRIIWDCATSTMNGSESWQILRLPRTCTLQKNKQKLTSQSKKKRPTKRIGKAKWKTDSLENKWISSSTELMFVKIWRKTDTFHQSIDLIKTNLTCDKFNCKELSFRILPQFGWMPIRINLNCQ